MGYFSNGTEGEMYEERYCKRCIHQEGCSIWLAHMLHNYDECNKKDSILHLLIPRVGISNGQCTMFVENTPCSPTKDATPLKTPPPEPCGQ